MTYRQSAIIDWNASMPQGRQAGAEQGDVPMHGRDGASELTQVKRR
jgi:hypothetical protein